MPTLYLICGLPGSGKTTKAKEIEIAKLALRLTPDEWILDLYGHDLDRKSRDNARKPVETLHWELAQRLLSLGCSVILDWGFWLVKERLAYRKRAEELGADVKVIFLEMSIEKLWERISKRPHSKKGTLQISREELEKWAAMYEPQTKNELAG